MQVPLLRFGSIDAEGQEPRTTSSSAVALWVYASTTSLLEPSGMIGSGP